MSLLEVTSAYGAFANRGLRIEPHAIREVVDPDGRTIYRTKPTVSEAVSPQVAYLINHVLYGGARFIQEGAITALTRELVAA